MKLFMSPLSKDPVLISFFSNAKTFFLAARCLYTALSPVTPSAARTSSHSAVLASPSLELPDKPDWGTGASHFFIHSFLNP